MARGLGQGIPRGQREQLAVLLRELRHEAGLRQEDLAAPLGVPDNVVSNLEIGERRLDVLELRLVCEALGLTMDEFIRRLEGALITYGELASPHAPGGSPRLTMGAVPSRRGRGLRERRVGSLSTCQISKGPLTRICEIDRSGLGCGRSPCPAIGRRTGPGVPSAEGVLTI